MTRRYAGDHPGYRLGLLQPIRSESGKELWTPTEYHVELPSVTTILGAVLGKPGGAMAWYGYRVALQGVMRLATENPAAVVSAESAEALEAMVRELGVDPNTSRDLAAARGSAAHEVLERLADGLPDDAAVLAETEEREHGTRYGYAVIDWWHAHNLTPHAVESERPVWSLRWRYAGTFDLLVREMAWLVDLKTHKPAAGFTRPGGGPAYLTDLLQLRAYREAYEEMGLGKIDGQVVLVARENGTWLEDRREVPVEFWWSVLQVYNCLQHFGKEE